MGSWPGWSCCRSISSSRSAGWMDGGAAHVTGLATQLVLDAPAAAAARPAPLRLLDRRREIDPAWFQRSRMIGYVCHADRFAGSLQGVRQHLDYLAELGVTYLHLMPLLRPREGDNDGGCAVADYGELDRRVARLPTWRRSRATCTSGVSPCASAWCSITRRQSTSGPR